MSFFEPNSRYLWEILIFCFHLKKTVAEAHQNLLSTYGEAGFSGRTCREWFQRFKRGYSDIADRHGSGKQIIFEDFELEALLAEDLCQIQDKSA